MSTADANVPNDGAITADEISKIDEKLGFYISNLKPFCAEHARNNNGKMPTWDEIKSKFPEQFGKGGPSIWFSNLVRKYDSKFLDKAKSKTNEYYNEDIAIPLKVRFESINEVSKKKRGRKTEIIAGDKAKKIADLL
jgi:hypothetical protein